MLQLLNCELGGAACGTWIPPVQVAFSLSLMPLAGEACQAEISQKHVYATTQKHPQTDLNKN